ncbi:MAG: rhombosortase [Candidatus Sumerlaeota bacterium]|nr:rhombosortase [Candidatus Sumerlaeota bacterium]
MITAFKSLAGWGGAEPLDSSRLAPSVIGCAKSISHMKLAAKLFAPLLFGLGALAIYLIPGANECLQFDRAAIGDGQWWRLITGHWTHWSGDHLLWDTAVFIILSACGTGFLGRAVDSTGPTRPTGPTSPTGLTASSAAIPFLVISAFILISALFISSAVWFLAPEMAVYRGLSGIDSALFVWVAIRIAQDQFHRREWMRMSIVVVVLAGFCFKVSYEFLTGATLFVQSNGIMTPVPLAHVAGAAIAILWLSVLIHNYGHVRRSL